MGLFVSDSRRQSSRRSSSATHAHWSRKRLSFAAPGASGSFFYPQECLIRCIPSLGWYCSLVAFCLFASPSAFSTPQSGTASWYSAESCRVNPDPRCPTASEQFLHTLIERGVPYAVMWDIPLGTSIRVCRANHDHPTLAYQGKHGKAGNPPCVVVRIEDRGPARRLGCLIDLNPQSFQAVCGSLRHGICAVTVEAMR